MGAGGCALGVLAEGRTGGGGWVMQLTLTCLSWKAWKDRNSKSAGQGGCRRVTLCLCAC